MPNTILAAGEAMPPRKQLDVLLEEAVKIIRDNPDLMIDNASANKHGIYTTLTIPGADEHPWTKAHRQMRELSITLDECDDATWFAHVMPPRPPKFTAFGAFPMSRTVDELPIDHIERLSWELSEALNRYQNGTFQAVVLPAGTAGHTVMLTKIDAFIRRAKV